jgi:hypothetical protein
MRKFLIITLILIFPVFALSQNILVYQGVYSENEQDSIIDNSDYNRQFDKVSYQYYENEKSERIFHGFFKLDEKEVILGFDSCLKDLKIDGQFKDNYKDGLWKISALVHNNCSSNDINDVFQLDTLANFSKGKLNGKCSAIGIDKKTKKNIFLSTATFKENIMIDQFIYKDFKKEIYIDINLNNEGYYDKDYLVKFTKYKINYEDRRKYKNGKLEYQLFRNMTNGNIIYKFDQTGEIDNSTDDIGGKNSYGYQWDLYNTFLYWTAGECRGNGIMITGASHIYLIHRGIDGENLIQEGELSDSSE